jgi:hypothetical protein
MLKAQVGPAMDRQSHILLKTIGDEDRSGLSSGLIRRGSRASAEDQTRAQLQVTDRADLTRTHARTLGKRVGGNPSRVRISYPPQECADEPQRGACRLKSTRPRAACRPADRMGKTRPGFSRAAMYLISDRTVAVCGGLAAQKTFSDEPCG